VRLDYMPLWAATGLIMERLDDALRALTVGSAAGATHGANVL